jgi:hypothetical protein
MNWEAGCDCIKCCALAIWWDWDLRSRPLHWNWSTDYQPTKRDGIIPWFLSPPPTVTTPQPVEKNGEIRGKVKEKLRKVQEKGYLKPGYVKALTSFFTVPKGDQDV